MHSVAKQRLKSPRVRLFVALDLPEAVRDGLAAWQAKALTDPALRPMRPESLHVTLCFLSYHPERAVPRIAELVTSASAAAGRDALRARALAAAEGAPAPVRGGRGERGGRRRSRPSSPRRSWPSASTSPRSAAFWPHVTVARVRSERLPPGRGERRGKGRPRRVTSPPGPLPAALTKPFGAVRVALYRSDLKPQGAEYVSLAGVDLPSP